MYTITMNKSLEWQGLVRAKQPEQLAEPTVDWSKLRLSEIAWQHTDSGRARGETFHILRSCTKTQLGEQVVELKAACRVVTNTADEATMLSFQFELIVEGQQTPSAEASIRIDDVHRTDRTAIANTHISRADQGHFQLPLGTGTALYEKVLDYLATLGKRKALTHKVWRSPADDNYERWDRNIRPLLEARGYTPSGEHTFEKTYS